MKNAAFAVMALTTLSHADLSRPIVRPILKNVRLEMRITPVPGLVGARTTVLSVLSNGVVTVRETQAIFPGGNVMRILTRLSRNEMHLLETYIDDVRFGEIVTLRPRIVCLAISDFIEQLSADNGRILLRRAPQICPREITYNSDPAAVKLEGRLRSLYGLYLTTLY